MKFDFSQPMTAYEVLAIVLAALALLIPVGKWIINRFIKKIKVTFIPSEYVTLSFNRSGAYITLGGVYESKNKSAIIKNVCVEVVRAIDNATLYLNWSTFPSPIYRKVAGGYETSFETAHPFKVDADGLTPVFIEFSNAMEDPNEKTSAIIRQVSNAVSPILLQPNIDLFTADSQVKQLKEYQDAKLELNDYFFWREGNYQIIVKTEYNNNIFSNSYIFSINKEESERLRANIDSLLVTRVADHFRVTSIINTVQKKYRENNGNL